MAILICFIISAILFMRGLVVILSKHYKLENFGMWLFSISFISMLISGLQLFQIIDFSKLI